MGLFKFAKKKKFIKHFIMSNRKKSEKLKGLCTNGKFQENKIMKKISKFMRII